jgi:hypothetical protein
MRGKVGEAGPPADDQDLEELVAEALPDGQGADASTTVHLVEHTRPPVAADLGPNGDVVLDLLTRANALTADEARRLGREASWRWGLVTPVPGTASLPVARAVALVRGRRDGRSEAVVALEAAVAAFSHRQPRRRGGSFLTAAVLNAGLAVLVRDLIESETFETLFGPWRAVMHH